MSHIDQAFIRAYGTEASQEAPMPTLPMHSAVAGAGSAGAGPHFPVAASSGPHDSNYALPEEADPYADEILLFDQPASAANAPEGLTERRPLSSFAAPREAPSEPSFRPLLEVDAFRWPAVCDQLLENYSDLFAPVVEQLIVAGEEGRSMVGLFGMRQQIGCTTMQLCLAKALAQAGKSVALVDADFSTAQLANRLGLDVETGWEDVLYGALPLAECVVQSMEDHIALLPLVRPVDAAVDLLSSIHASVSAGMLRYQFDLVLFDLGTAGAEPQAAAARAIGTQCRLDACLAVADPESQPSLLAEIQQIATGLGADCLGVVENQIS